MRVSAWAAGLLTVVSLAACASTGDDAPIEGLQAKPQACTGGDLQADPRLPEPMVFDLVGSLGETGRVRKMELRVVKGSKDRRAQRMALSNIEMHLGSLRCPDVSLLRARVHMGPKQVGYLNERVERSQ